jgi:hydrogenase large subunit
MPRITIDPVTRIEGHLRVEAQVEDGFVKDAWCAGTQFRGMEIILKGRDPRGAWLFAQRICGVCTTVHALASVRAVENALGIKIPSNANLIRNIIAGIQFIQDHVVHFYHLQALDWVDPWSALQADPNETAKIAQSISDWPTSSPDHFKAVQERLKALVNSGQLSIFTSAYFGHPAYRLTPEVNLLAVAHYLEALGFQREIVKVHALLGGKNPHPQTYLVGGMAIPLDLNSESAFNAGGIARLGQLFQQAKAFVEQVYLPDIIAIASFYKDWFSIGGGEGNYLAYGEFPTEADRPETKLFPAGAIFRSSENIQPVDQRRITEYVTHSWYKYAQGNQAGLQPFDGETKPDYTGPQPPYEFLETNQKYSWNKAPRYEEKPMEVGPLARVLVAYAKGNGRVKKLVDNVLQQLGIGPEALHSTLGRMSARAVETQVIAEELSLWLNLLVANMKRQDLRNFNGEKWEPASWPNETEGYGFHGAPRGALGHWIRIKNGAIANYQCVVPTTWNASPRDAKGQRGPYETALLNTPIADPERPIEILRTVHSFDPCMACAAHVLDRHGKEITKVRVV